MQRWEKEIKEKDRSLTTQKTVSRPVPPVRASGGTIPLGVTTVAAPVKSVKTETRSKGETALSTRAQTFHSEFRLLGNSAADHTYDKGYKKWETFDVDTALEDVDTTETEERQTPSPVAARPPVSTASFSSSLFQNIFNIPLFFSFSLLSIASDRLL